MQLIRKTFILEGLENIKVDFIENFISNTGFEPLRWAVVEVKEDKNKFTVEAVVVK